MIENVNLGKYEIHFDNSYGIVKDKEKSIYFRLSGCSYKYLIDNYNKPNFSERLEKELKNKYPDNITDNTLIRIMYKNHLEGLFKIIPRFMFNYIIVLSTISILLLIGTLSITFNIQTQYQNESNIIIYILFLILNILFHEFGHILFCLKAGREVKSYGFKLNYGLPMFYVDTSDICMGTKKDKILTSLGGIYFNSLFGILIFLFYIICNNIFALDLLNISYFFVVSNILPFVKLDGYYVISDLLEVNNLNKTAYINLINLLKNPSNLTCKKIFLSFYYIFSFLFIVFIAIGVISTLYNWVMT